MIFAGLSLVLSFFLKLQTVPVRMFSLLLWEEIQLVFVRAYVREEEKKHVNW